MSSSVNNNKTENATFVDSMPPIEEKVENRNNGPVRRDISPIALAILLLEIKLDNIEDGATARREKRELQNRVKECNDNVVGNLRSESALNTFGPIAVLIISGLFATRGLGLASEFISEQAASGLSSTTAQIFMPLINGIDQWNFATDKEKNDREKQITDQELQTTHAQAQSAREAFNSDLKRAMETILNS